MEKPSFSGGYGWFRPHEGNPYIESGKKPLYQVSSSGIWQQNGELSNYDVFPAVSGTGRLVIPLQVMGAEADLVWELKQDATQEAAGTTVTLQSWEREGDRIAFEWMFPRDGVLFEFAEFEAVDASGKIYHPDVNVSSMSGDPVERKERRTIESTLPPEVNPVAIRAKQLGVRVDGPWVFDLPE